MLSYRSKRKITRAKIAIRTKNRIPTQHEKIILMPNQRIPIITMAANILNIVLINIPPKVFELI